MENIHDTTDTTDTTDTFETTDTTLRAQLVCADCGLGLDLTDHTGCTTVEAAAARLIALREHEQQPAPAPAPALDLGPARTEAELEADSSDYARLGVNYFAAHDIANRVMDKFAAEMFKPLVEKFTKEFQDKLWSVINDWLIEDTQSNIASEINTRIERTIEALLTGNRHYIDQFVLPAYSSHGEAIRAAIAHAIPEELQMRRIKDLEDQVESLTRSLEYRLGVR